MEAFIGEIRLFPYVNVIPPQGWLLCDGSSYSPHQYAALCSIIGNIYGGTLPSSFNVPKLAGLVPVGYGQGPGLANYPLASTGGAAAVTLSQNQLATHTHNVAVSSNDAASTGTATPGPTTIFGQSLGSKLSPAPKVYLTGSTQPTVSMAANSVLAAGGAPSGTMAHNNMQPYLPLYFCIAWDGIYPEKPGM